MPRHSRSGRRRWSGPVRRSPPAARARSPLAAGPPVMLAPSLAVRWFPGTPGGARCAAHRVARRAGGFRQTAGPQRRTADRRPRAPSSAGTGSGRAPTSLPAATAAR